MRRSTLPGCPTAGRGEGEAMHANVVLCARLCVIALTVGAALPAEAGQDQRLVTAAATEDMQSVRALLEEGVDVNVSRADGATALLWAAHWDDLPTVDLLLAAGADINAADDHGVTPLERAAENASVAMVDRLLAEGADANAAQKSGLTPLMIAARTGNVGVGQRRSVDARLVSATRTRRPLCWLRARESERQSTAPAGQGAPGQGCRPQRADHHVGDDHELHRLSEKGRV